MKDNKLIELAAKAVGPKVVRKVECSGGFELVEMSSGLRWNPLEDDGAALRLAVELKMSVTVFDDAVGIGVNPDFGYREYDISHDQNTSTRRAIVRAAAEIGKSMQP